jgi:SAM-dependent methyltransferase
MRGSPELLASAVVTSSQRRAFTRHPHAAPRDAHVSIVIHIRNMNLVHGILCSSGWWAGRVETKLLPWALEDIDLGDDVLEFGPGFGATTRVLAGRGATRISALELEPRYCEQLRRDLAGVVDIVQGDATRMPFPDGRFSAAVCFTMLHHLPSREAQDRALSETLRVLRPGGVFAGTDSVGNGMLFRVIHFADTLVKIDPAGFPDRLAAVGFAGIEVDSTERSFRFRAQRPA